MANAYEDMNQREAVVEEGYEPHRSWYAHKGLGLPGGVDHMAAYGAPLFANAAGKVETISLKDGGYGGRTIKLNIGDTGWFDLYKHLSDFAVKDGDTVKQGQLIGFAGGSGDGHELAHTPIFHLSHVSTADPDLGEWEVNPWFYFGGDGVTDMRKVRPERIVKTLETGIPDLAFWKNLQWWSRQYGFVYACNGFMSVPAWKAVQTGLQEIGFKGKIDGRPDKPTYVDLQRLAHDNGSKSVHVGKLDAQDFVALSKFLNTVD